MLRIGSHNVDFPFVLAPMAGITDMVFRTLMKELGAGIVVSELVSCHGMMHGSRKTYDLLRFDPRERPVGLQIFGEDPHILGRAAAEIERLGADFVDLNLGCPVPKVVSRGGGSAMLRDPLKLERVLIEMKRYISIPLTIKIRTGWDESERNAAECVKAAANAGVAWVAIHGRTRAQGYSGLADWDMIRHCKAVATIPIIGNGDVVTADGALARLTESGCDAIMIGRGALANPWIFQEIRARLDGRTLDKSTYDVIGLLRRHRQLIEELNPGFHAAISLRKFAAWYSHGYPNSATFRSQIFRTNSLQEVEDLAVEFYDTVRHIPICDKGTEAFLRAGHG